MTTFIISSDMWMCEMCKSLQIDPRFVDRLVVDARSGEPVRVWMSMIGGKEIIDLRLPPDAEIQTYKATVGERPRVFMEL